MRNKIRNEVSLPLYRLNYRLRIGDWASVEEPAEKMYPFYRSRRSRTAAVVAMARCSADCRLSVVKQPWNLGCICTSYFASVC